MSSRPLPEFLCGHSRNIVIIRAVTIQWTGLLDWTTGLTKDSGNEQEYTEIRQRHAGKTWLFSIAPRASPQW